MQNWDKKNSICKKKNDIKLIKSICKQYKIKLLFTNFTIEYLTYVFEKMLNKFKNGETPNPDILCNKEIKFKVLIYHLIIIYKNFYLATGHYAKIITINKTQILAIPKDKKKDQTYFLYAIEYKKLKIITFPLESYLKKNIRIQAKKINLENYNKKSSTGICFIEEKNFIVFLQKYIKKNTGIIVDDKGNYINKHDGISFYTIGQKKGITYNIKDNKKLFYVIKKNKKKNKLIIAQLNKNLITTNCLITHYTTYITLKKPATIYVCGKMRYNQQLQKNLLYIKRKKILAFFYKKQKYIASGQHYVFYLNNFCLGGGLIL